MSLSVKIDTVRYRNDLNQFVEKLNADAQILLKEEMRLLLRDISRLTPPKTLAQGRKAVAGDVSRAVGSLDPEKIKWPEMKKAVIAKDVAAINAMTKNLKNGYFANRRLLTSIDQVAGAHISARNSRGRVRSDQGNMTFANIWRKYAKSVQDRVGYARAGWAAAAQGVGLNLPSWVARHAAYSKGTYKAPSAGTLEIVGTNRSAKIPNYQSVVDAAARMRVNSLGKELKRILDGGKSRRASLAGTKFGQAD